MQNLNRLWQLAGAAASVRDTVRDLTHQQRVDHFSLIRQPVTFYLQTEAASLTIIRWHEPRIELHTRLQASFGWRVATDQDEAGVYVVAKRRAVVGTLSGGLAAATFVIRVPVDTYLILKLDDCELIQTHLSGTLHLPPGETASGGTLPPRLPG